MQKFLVETTGEFQLVDMDNNQIVNAHRPSVAKASALVQGRIALGQVRILGEVNAEATDEEFAKYVEDSEDVNLAVAAFLAAYTVEVEVQEKPKRAAAKKATND